MAGDEFKQSFAVIDQWKRRRWRRKRRRRSRGKEEGDEHDEEFFVGVIIAMSISNCKWLW